MGLYQAEPAAPTVKVIGNETLGTIAVPVLGGLTIEEDDTIAEILDSADSVVVLASRTAQAIALAEEDVTDLEAYRIIEDATFHRDMEPAAQAVSIRHAEAIQKVREAYKTMGTLRRRAVVTAILRHRLGESEIPAGFPRALFDAIAAIGEEEQAAEKMPPKPMTAKALGKPPRERMPARKRIGTSDSGS